MPTKFDIINSKQTKDGEYLKVPRAGLNITWGNKVLCIVADDSGFRFFNGAPTEGKLKRFKFLPRISGEIDYAGKRYTFKNAPLIETIQNLSGKKLSLQTLMSLTHEQLAEVLLPGTQLEKTKKQP